LYVVSLTSVISDYLKRGRMTASIKNF